MTAMMSEAMNWVVRLAGLLVAVAIGASWLRQQVAVAAGAPRALSDLWLRLAGVVIGFIVVLAAPEFTNLLRAFVQGGAGDLRANLPTLAKLIVDGLIFLGGLVLALGLAGHWLGAQLSLAAGNPSGLSRTWLRLLGIVAAFLGLLATIPVANLLIDRLAR